MCDVQVVVVWPSLGRLALGSFGARSGGSSGPLGSFQEVPRGFSRLQRSRSALGCFRRHHEAPTGRRNFNWPQEAFKGPQDFRKGFNWHQKAPEGPRRPQEAPAGPRIRPGPASPAFRSMHHNGQHTVNSRSTRRSTRGQHNGQHPLKSMNCLELVEKHALGFNK